MTDTGKALASVKPSLGARLLQHAMLPLALTWALGAGIALLIGDSFTQQAFDRALLDGAYVVSSHVAQEEAGLAPWLRPRGNLCVLDNPLRRPAPARRATEAARRCGPRGRHRANDAGAQPVAAVDPLLALAFAEETRANGNPCCSAGRSGRTANVSAIVSAKGAGLGLAIVARCAELLDARFELGAAPAEIGLRASLVFKRDAA